MRFAFLALAFSLVFPLVVFCNEQVAKDPAKPCVPGFLELFEEPIRAPTGSWQVSFQAALIGCQDSLAGFSDMELERLRNELITPKEWSNIWLLRDHAKEEFRATVVAQLNTAMDRNVVTDVIFHDIKIYDNYIR
jgi:hypothetical protein